jgi:NMD protein affecting ribosome stability and mRNA decay
MKKTHVPQDSAPGMSHQGRHERFLKTWEHGAHKAKSKLPEPTACPGCDAVYHQGRWQWSPVPADAQHHLCPACQRIRDRAPVGYLHLSGKFFDQHRDEIMRLVRHVEMREKNQHPLERIMDVSEDQDGTLISFTGPHLTRGAGEAINHAYQGELDFHYVEEDITMRVKWHRD